MRLVIISGVSGSGKSVALHVLEDLGFYCIDNIPVPLLRPFIDEIVPRQDPAFENVGIGLDARSRPSDLAEVPALVHKLRAEGLSDRGAVFGRPDLAAIARGFGIGGETIADLAALPALIARFAKSGGAAVWDVPISDRVQSPVIRRAHPSGPSHKGPA